MPFASYCFELAAIHEEVVTSGLPFLFLCPPLYIPGFLISFVFVSIFVLYVPFFFLHLQLGQTEMIECTSQGQIQDLSKRGAQLETATIFAY